MATKKDRKPDPVDESSEESFPASDPPTYSGMHSGARVPDEACGECAADKEKPKHPRDANEPPASR